MTSLFISYSRKDIEVAKKLTEALNGQGLDFWIDWEGIPPTVDWWKEIEKGIEEADIFLFLISPDSATSKVCKQEIECAMKNGKRLIPLVVRDIKGNEAPIELSHLNWIFLRENDNFESTFSKLLTAIKTDYEWVQVHRQIQVKALEWERTNKENSFLLRGKELQDAELQLATNSIKEPHPTELQREYVLKSRQATDRQRRITTSISIAGIITLAALAVFGFIQAGYARNAQATAEVNLSIAQTAQIDAQNKEAARATQQALAEEKANIALARQLSAQSQNNLINDPAVSTLLSMEALHIYPDISGKQSLYDSLISLGSAPSMVLTQFGSDAGLLYNHRISPDGNWLAAAIGPEGTDTILRLWDLRSPAEAPRVLFGPENGKNDFLEFSPDGQWLFSLNNSTIRIWDMKNIEAGPRLLQDEHNGIIFFKFSPKGKWLATLGMDGTLQIRSSQESFNSPFHPRNQKGSVWALEFSQDENWLVAGTTISNVQSGEISGGGQYIAGSSESGIQLWNLSSIDSPPQVWNGEIQSNTPLAISADGQKIAGVGTNNRIYLWQTNVPDSYSEILNNKTDINILAFCNGGKELAVTSPNGDLQVWQLEGQIDSPRILQSGGEISDLSVVSPDSRWLAITSTGMMRTSIVRLWDLQSPLVSPRILRGFDSWIFSSRFGSNSQWLFSRSGSGNVWAWDLNAFEEEPHILNNPGNIVTFGYSSRGGFIAGIDRDSTVWLWNTNRLSNEPVILERNIVPTQEDFYPSPIFSPEGRYLAIDGRQGNIHVWNLSSLEKGERKLQSKGQAHSSILFSQDGKWLASLSDAEGLLQLWDMASASNNPIYPAPLSTQFSTFAFSHSTGKLAAIDLANNAWIWDTNTIQDQPQIIQKPLSNSPYGTVQLAFSPDDQTLIGVETYGIINNWNLQTSSSQWTTLPNYDFGDAPAYLSLSYDGHWLVGRNINPEKNLRLWDLSSTAMQPYLLFSESLIYEVRFSQDGQWLASGNTNFGYFGDTSDPYIIQIWDLKSPETQPIILRVQSTSKVNVFLSGLEFSDNGSKLVSLFKESDFRVWNLDFNDLIQIGCRRVGRNLTRVEWNQFIGNTLPYQEVCENLPIEPEITPTP